MHKLLFIYNAGSGKVNASLDMFHKVFSPATYNCNLCRITYGIFEENKTWKNFRKSSDFDMEFLHADEFQKKYASKFGYKFTYLIVLAADQKGLEVFISSEELNSLKGPEELIYLIEKRKTLYQ